MKNRTYLFAAIAMIAAFCQPSQLSAQNQWTLKQCIEYAIAHNVTVRQSAVTAEQKKIDVNTRKWARLPQVQGSVTQNSSWGRSASLMNNSYSDTHSNNTSFAINSTVPIFSGFKIPNEYKLSQLNLKASIADLQKAKDDLSINIASSYLQALLDKELWKVSQEQIALSLQQLNRLVGMEAIGKASKAEVAEARSNVEQNKMSAVQNENSYKLAMLDLSQMLELPTPEGLGIVQPADSVVKFMVLSPPDDIYQIAMAQKPAIQAAKYRLNASDFNIKIARAGYMPQLSLNLGLGTNYYTMSGVEASSFGAQMSNNMNKYVGLSLSIPIFDAFSTRNNIQTAKMQQMDYALQLESTKKELYKEIQQAWYNAIASESKYNSSVSALDASKASFLLVREKYENDKATAVEYNEAQVKLQKSESELIQSKYDYLFRSKILAFYKGESIE